MKIEKIRNKIIKTYNKIDKLSNKIYSKCFIYDIINNKKILNYNEPHDTEFTLVICNEIEHGLKLVNEILRVTKNYNVVDNPNNIKNWVHNNKITYIYLMCCLYTKDVSFYDEKMDSLIDEMINLLHLLERSL